MQLDTAKFSEDAATRKRAEDLVALLTPVAKAFLTDLGLETTVHGQQIFGGHGYIREWGQEQLVRDVRITQIYEGTNGIQALDLVGRKIVGSGGAFYKLFADEIRQFTATASADLAEFTKPLNDAVDNLDELTAWVLDRAKSNPNEIGAASVEYLHVRLHGLRLHVGTDGQGCVGQRSAGRFLRQQAGHGAFLRPPAAAYSLVECVGEGRQRVAVPAGCSAVLKVLRHVSILLHDVLLLLP
jgi:hypothetical protein